MDQVIEDALKDLECAQSQWKAAGERMEQYKVQFREDRDAAICKAVAVGAKRAEVAAITQTSPQWVNKVLRGKAYRGDNS